MDTTLPKYAGKEITGNPTTSYVTYNGKNYEYVGDNPLAARYKKSNPADNEEGLGDDTTLNDDLGTDGSGNKTLKDRYANAKKKLDNAFNMDQPNEQAIRDAEMGRVQGVIDRINSKFASIEAADTAQIDLMNRERRAANVMNGLSGSTVGAERTIQTAEKGANIRKLTASQKAAETTETILNAEARASQEFKAQKEAFIKNSKDKLVAEQGLNDKIDKEARSELTHLSAKYSWDELQKDHPDLLTQYMQETGMNETALKAFYVSQKPEATKEFSQKIGNNWVMGFRDPETGKLSVETMPLPADGGNWTFQNVGGEGYFINTTTREMRPANGGSPSGSPTGNKQVKDAPTGFTEDAIGVARENLKKFGHNGYAEPAFYVDAYQQWKIGGGKDAKFYELFPPDEFVNPTEADLLPTWLQPKKSAKTAATPAQSPTSTTTSSGRAY